MTCQHGCAHVSIHVYVRSESRWTKLLPNMKIELEIPYICHSKSQNEIKEDHGRISQIQDLVLSGRYEDLLETDEGKSVLNSYSGTRDGKDIVYIIEGSVRAYIKNGQQGDREFREFVILSVGVASLQLYIQSNWTGPPVKDSPWRHMLCIQEEKTKVLEKEVHCALGVDGESAYNLSKHPFYLLIAKTILLNCRDEFTDCQTADLWLMRCLQVQQTLISERSPTLKATVMDLIKQIKTKEPLMTGKHFRPAQLQFHIEAGHLCYFYYEPTEATAHFKQAKKIAGLSIELTGMLGKRTKFQQKSLAQLVLKVSREEEPIEEPERIGCELPKNISLDDETVLNQIALEEDDPDLHTKLSALELALLLALCHEHKKTSESVGDILKEECLAFVNTVLSDPENWCVQSMGLLMRTYWESESPRRLERTMAQLEELVKQIDTASCNPSHRTHLVYCSRWQPLWHLKKELGELLQKIGLINSALDLFLSLEMWEDVIQCYKSLDRMGAAEQVIRAELAKSETPAMWCHLGNVLNDPECYRTAWELSGHHYSVAQRNLALFHLRKGEFEESIPCFAKSVEINPLQLGVWFSYGCASMALKKWDIAARAFRRCVNIETQNFEAWNNLASVYIRSNQKVRAFSAMQEALKCEYENWRVWDNFLVLSTDLGEFNEAMRAYHRLLDLKDKHDDAEVLSILVSAVTRNLEDASGQPASHCRPKLLELFGRVTSKVTSNAVIWKQYSKLLVEENADLSSEDCHRALQYLQKSHRCLTLSPSWEKDIPKCKEVIQESIDISKRYRDLAPQIKEHVQASQFLSSARLMLKGTLTRIVKQHTDPALGSLYSELVDPCKELEDEVTEITQLATEIRERSA